MQLARSTEMMHIRRLLLTPPAQQGWFHVVQKDLVRERSGSFIKQPDLQERGESQSKARQVKGHSAKPSSAGEPELLQSFILVPASKMKDGNKIRTWCPYPFQNSISEYSSIPMKNIWLHVCHISRLSCCRSRWLHTPHGRSWLWTQTKTALNIHKCHF